MTKIFSGIFLLPLFVKTRILLSYYVDQVSFGLTTTTSKNGTGHKVVLCVHNHRTRAFEEASQILGAAEKKTSFKRLNAEMSKCNLQFFHLSDMMCQAHIPITLLELFKPISSVKTITISTTEDKDCVEKRLFQSQLAFHARSTTSIQMRDQFNITSSERARIILFEYALCLC